MERAELPERLNPALFPALSTWEWRPITKKDEVVKAGDSIEIYDEFAAGWLYYAFIKMDNPDLEVAVDLQADRTVEVRASPRRLQEAGAVGRGGIGFTLMRYDDANKVYAMEYAPSTGFLGTPFRGRNRGVVKNPTGEDATIVEGAIWLIILKPWAELGK